MFKSTHAFSGFSVDDLDAAKTFYGDTLGLSVVATEMRTLMMALPGGGEAVIYPKDNHQPATFTVLNFAVANVEAAVDELNELGVRTKIYGDADAGGELSADLGTDAKGIMRGHGPDIAWFKDPAGNVLSVIAAGV